MIFKLSYITLLLICFAGALSGSEPDNHSISLPENPEHFVEENLSEQSPVVIADSLIRKGIDLRNAKKIKRSLEYLNKALDIGKEEDNARLRFLAINNIGLCYYISSEYAKALDHYLKAFQIAIRDLPAKYEQTILNNIAIVYNADGKKEKALHFFKKAYESAIDLKMFKKAAHYGINLATLYNDLGKYDTARNMLESAMKYTEPGSDNYYYARVSLAESYEFAGNLEKARKILRQMVDKDTDLSGDVSVFAHNRLAKVLHQMGHYEDAEKIALKGASIAKSINDINSQYDAYDLLSQISKKRNDYKKAFAYLQKTRELSDTLQYLKNQEKLSELQGKFELSKYEYELEAAEEKYASLQKFNTIMIISVILIAILAIYTVRVRWINMRQKNSLLQKKEDISALELEKSQAQQMALEQELKRNEERSALNEKLLREEIEMKNREISSKALINATKNDTIHQVIDQIEQLDQKEDQNIRALKRELKGTINIEKDWNDFVVHFEQIHEGFFQRLQDQHPNLNNNDLRLVAYLRINLGSKEIARLLNITPASYRKRKMRLKEKMGLERDENVEKYIYNL
ncbi:MAG: tetratricopeptide repeat protein [Bacteroidales bacterium]|nr:tetratricopeptide repeat protein [Bacteroidales bacterium]